MSNDFKSKCKLFSERLNILYELLAELKQRIILQDLSNELNTQVKIGRHLISNVDWLEEIDVGGETLSSVTW